MFYVDRLTPLSLNSRFTLPSTLLLLLQGGGAFSVIKESIGPEFGGTVGTLLFLSNCFGIAMYVLACVEIFQIWPLTEPALGGISIRVLGAIILFSLFTVVFVGISYISKFSMLFMVNALLFLPPLSI